LGALLAQPRVVVDAHVAVQLAAHGDLLRHRRRARGEQEQQPRHARTLLCARACSQTNSPPSSRWRALLATVLRRRVLLGGKMTPRVQGAVWRCALAHGDAMAAALVAVLMGAPHVAVLVAATFVCAADAPALLARLVRDGDVAASFARFGLPRKIRRS